ncbi:hypothetical protein [Lapillicoccus jejuensis]|uniref:VapC45 PIN like domain-containing protein n=1 Tax=Lapillicoccus jejuensis TaxID=402171 RepID=A0A542E0E6_9MICO|nr:hypothetical protein [Lapillicoccus jejuensis]TQJ08820.1 hypothetical protein FB458_1917 [Lapillicoccus jejuensis]
MTHSSSAPEPNARLVGLPHVFIDRSLGAVQLPRALRAAGIELTTMREHYGESLAQATADPDWIALTAERGWIGFHKDAAIRRNDLERAAVRSTGARLFCVPRADITADELAARYLNNIAAIVRAAQQPGPYIYGVYTDEIRSLPLG